MLKGEIQRYCGRLLGRKYLEFHESVVSLHIRRPAMLKEDPRKRQVHPEISAGNTPFIPSRSKTPTHPP
jgi:hypothetical protein